MHKFLRAIGFSELKKKDLEILTEEIIENPELMKVTRDSEGNEFAEFTRTFAENMGLVVRGNYNEEDEFVPEYVLPFFDGRCNTTDEVIEIEKHAEKETYAGICDDPHLGLTLIFFINNVADYLAVHKKNPLHAKVKGATLSALSVDGKILLPLEAKKTKSAEKRNENRSKLIAEARDGDESAIENLTVQDMDIYSRLSRRIKKEDLMTIVSTSFMPYGIESDQYGILANILELETITNQITGEEIYCMKVECNDLEFDVCINHKDLAGEPMVGRRLKANIWMQGNVCL